MQIDIQARDISLMNALYSHNKSGSGVVYEAF